MKTGTCQECGGACDHRAGRCQSCANKARASAQWSDPAIRQKMMDAITSYRRATRTTFTDLSWDTKWQRKTDGRHYAWYWDGDQRRTIYRYQWVWIQANGPIPKGYEIHHKSEDKADDRLGNLECLPKPKHARKHGMQFADRALAARGIEPLNGATATCQTCGTEFRIRSRNKANRYCSQPCRIKAMQTERICPTCGKTFVGGLDHGKPRKYCSRDCSLTTPRSTT